MWRKHGIKKKTCINVYIFTWESLGRLYQKVIIMAASNDKRDLCFTMNSVKNFTSLSYAYIIFSTI